MAKITENKVWKLIDTINEAITIADSAALFKFTQEFFGVTAPDELFEVGQDLRKVQIKAVQLLAILEELSNEREDKD